MLQLTHNNCQIFVTDAPGYAAGSADNVQSYDLVYDLTDGEFRPTSQHAVAVEGGGTGVRSCVVLAGGGATGVHPHSALVHGDRCLLAIGPLVCALSLPTLDLLWRAEVDAATCFGIYHAVGQGGYVSHGELEVARVSYEGEVLWRASGKDIFTNGFTLHEDRVAVVDWDDERYWVDLATGACALAEV